MQLCVLSHLQDLYMHKATALESEGKLREAEQMLCTIKEYDAAIKMYRQLKMYDQVIRMVSQHRKVPINQSTNQLH